MISINQWNSTLTVAFFCDLVKKHYIIIWALLFFNLYFYIFFTLCPSPKKDTTNYISSLELLRVLAVFFAILHINLLQVARVHDIILCNSYASK